MAHRNRREFLADVGKGMVVATVGSQMATGLGMAPCAAADAPDTLTFGSLEPMAALMQETAPDKLLPILVEKLNSGTKIRELIAAGALANARSFGGEDYIGFHTMMAMMPAYHMANELPKDRAALPVLKVLYRNSSRIQATGGRKTEILHAVPMSPANGPGALPTGAEALKDAVHKRDSARADAILAAAVRRSASDAFNDAIAVVSEQLEVHRVVLPYRAWDLLEVLGPEHAHTMLRQSMHYCVKAESHKNTQWDEIRDLLPKVLEENRLLDRTPGAKPADDAWIASFSDQLFKATPADAARMVAAALAEGFAPDTINEAVSIAANQITLRDTGRPPEWEAEGKPTGSVHGDSIGVHACDSANAWRNMSRIGNTRNVYACSILGAYQFALDRSRGPWLQSRTPLPVTYHVAQVQGKTQEALLAELEGAIRLQLQGRAAAITHKMGELNMPSRPIFDVLLKYAISEDGSLHAEKYYRTCCQEFATTRPAFRWRQLVALARVTASEYGRPAPGYADAVKLLKLI